MTEEQLQSIYNSIRESNSFQGYEKVEDGLTDDYELGIYTCHDNEKVKTCFLRYRPNGTTNIVLNTLDVDLFLTSALTGCLFVACKNEKDEVCAIHANKDFTKIPEAIKLPEKEYDSLARFHIKPADKKFEFSLVDYKSNIQTQFLNVPYESILFCRIPKIQDGYTQNIGFLCYDKRYLNISSYDPSKNYCHIMGAKIDSDWKFYDVGYTPQKQGIKLHDQKEEKGSPCC